MRTFKFFKFGFLVVSFLLATNTILNAQNKSSFEDSVNITIDKNTTQEDFKNITDILEENSITAEFKNVKRNDSDEITGLSIMLSSELGQQTSSSISGNRPINSITFGSKNGALYIGRGRGNAGIMNLFNNNNLAMPFEMDSIFGSNGMGFKMSDFFNGNSNLFSFDSDSIDIKDLQKRFKQNFNFNQNSPNSFSFSNGKTDDAPKYRFVDNPDKETLIVIDGEISDFKTLDNLAKSNQLADVDVLKAETAMSIYGDKARDGAIIAIRKK